VAGRGERRDRTGKDAHGASGVVPATDPTGLDFRSLLDDDDNIIELETQLIRVPAVVVV